MAQTYQGGLFLSSQASVDIAVDILTDGGYTGISGTLWIGALPQQTPAVLWDLSGLSMLDSVGSIHIENTDSLKNLHGLENLAYAGNGALFIIANQDLESIAALSNVAFPNMGNGLDSDLRVQENPKLQSLEGLNNIYRVGGQMRINENPELTDLSALGNLNYVRDLISISEIGATNLDGMGSIVDGEYDFFLHNCPNLTDITALSTWDTVPAIYVWEMPVLADLSPLAGVTLAINTPIHLQSARLTIHDCPMVEDIPLFNYPYNAVRQINLEDLPSLKSVTGLLSLEYILSFDVNNTGLDSLHLPNFKWGGGFGC